MDKSMDVQARSSEGAGDTPADGAAGEPRSSDTAATQNATATNGQPAGVEPAADTDQPGFGQRGRMRRRLRFLRKTRELAYRDLGGLVFEMQRLGERHDELVSAKLTLLGALDSELRTLEAALGDRRPVTVLREAGIATCPRCAAMHGSADHFCPACGLAMGSHADRPIGVAPAFPARAASVPAANTEVAPPVATAAGLAVPPAASASPTPAPVSPAPASSVPVGPTPASSVPVGPTPASPTPASPAPASPTPASPAPASPAPASPISAQPAPAGPAQARPAPASPAPARSAPASPVPPSPPDADDRPTEIIRPTDGGRSA